MAVTQIPVTVKGAEQLKEELLRLRSVDRPWVIQAIAEARAQGDLSENADYDAARSEQAQVEGRIQELEKILENAVIIEKRDTDSVSLGTTVRVKYIDDDDDEVLFGHNI